MTANRMAFLTMIAHSEIGKDLLVVSDDGYNVIVGSTVLHPDLFTSYKDHPRKLVRLSPTLSSTAAGRYQLLARYFDTYKSSLGLPDFSPSSQDAIAIQQIRECHALGDVDGGNFESAIKKIAHIWASMPEAGYGQHQNEMASLQAVYVAAGGTLS